MYADRADGAKGLDEVVGECERTVVPDDLRGDASHRMLRPRRDEHAHLEHSVAPDTICPAGCELLALVDGRNNEATRALARGVDRSVDGFHFLPP